MDAHAENIVESGTVRRCGADFTDFRPVYQSRSRSPTRRQDFGQMMINKGVRCVECSMCGDLGVMACLDWHLPPVCPLLISPVIMDVYNSFFLFYSRFSDEQVELPDSFSSGVFLEW